MIGLPRILLPVVVAASAGLNLYFAQRLAVEDEPPQAPGREPLSCRERLAAIVGVLPAADQFHFLRTTRSPEGMTEAVERIFRGTRIQHGLECRGDLCRLQLVMPSPPDLPNWTTALQRDVALGKWVRAFAFSAGYPGTDPVSHEGTYRTDVYLHLAVARDVSDWLREDR